MKMRLQNYAGNNLLRSADLQLIGGYLYLGLMLLGMAFSPAGKHPQFYMLKVSVEGIEKIEGELLLGLFQSEEGWPDNDNAIVKEAGAKVSGEQELLMIDSLLYGDYAFALFQDLNGNKMLDRNFFGIPTEPYAFSRNYEPVFRKPYFEECSFEMDGDRRMVVRLIN